ncbi:hypothetical protein K458DRAFT_415481 [Lentithecium fluviatile CBS 122367]|uniref:FAR1 domain-containing protein n=1 Tax=Lentithecium fluviatile CBS 122367 TaxID=1168545 RepID=A0A6G1JAM8_9PLEO|nr:hypothetical protein K458DRAFT_415481 [Lentithecium fluviatile CBS 122367]
MRPLPSHRLLSDLPYEITTSRPAYPSFPTSLHQVDSSNDRDLSNYGIISSPAEHHVVPSQHDHVEPLDPNLSPAGTPIGRQFQPDSSPVQQQHGFPPPNTSSPRPSGTPNPPPPPIIPNSAPPGHFDMQPPPASTHASWQALHEYAQSHASEHGYALSINTTAKNRSRIKLACVCYGAPKNTHKLTPETRVRKNRVSYKTGCKMWIEGKKQDDGLWALRVGEPLHNHPGRAVEGWAAQRKRTWGVQGGRVGVGGVTAKEEKARLHGVDDGRAGKAEEEGAQNKSVQTPAQPQKSSHSLETGGLVWKIVEQEMLRKGGSGQGRDRGVGRTVKILEERLPGIHIFKRDVYNIRAQIKRARKAAGQLIGEGLDDSDNEEDVDGDGEADDQHPSSSHPHSYAPNPNSISALPSSSSDQPFSQIDPTLIAQCNSALQNIPLKQEPEVERLRREVRELKQALARQTKVLEVKNGEIEGLRVQVELANMALYNERGGPGQ